MVTLCIVGFGKNIQPFASALRDEFKSFVQQQNGHVYNSNTLWKAEADPELLKKNARITFSKSAFGSHYVGVVNTDDSDELHSRFFSSSMPHTNVIYGLQAYYSKSRFLSRIKDLYNLPKPKSRIGAFDFEISYRYETIGESEELCVVEWSLQDKLDPFVVFPFLISKLDRNFPDIFTSAYIKDSSEESSYSDRELLNLKIPDGGYAFYICDRIKAFHGITSADNSKYYTENALSGGTLYEFVGGPDEFNYHFHLWNFPALEKALIPHHSVIDWSDLSEEKLASLTYFDTVSVYHDRYSPMNPTIAFSFGYTNTELDARMDPLVWQERYGRDFLTRLFETNQNHR